MDGDITKIGTWGGIVARSAAVASWAALLAGCAARVPEHPRGVAVGNQGGSWEVIFPGPRPMEDGRVASALAFSGAEVGRRDAALAGPVEAYAPADTWTARSSRLDDLRRVSLPSQPDTVLYFRARPSR